MVAWVVAWLRDCVIGRLAGLCLRFVVGWMGMGKVGCWPGWKQDGLWKQDAIDDESAHINCEICAEPCVEDTDIARSLRSHITLLLLPPARCCCTLHALLLHTPRAAVALRPLCCCWLLPSSFRHGERVAVVSSMLCATQPLSCHRRAAGASVPLSG